MRIMLALTLFCAFAAAACSEDVREFAIATATPGVDVPTQSAIEPTQPSAPPPTAVPPTPVPVVPTQPPQQLVPPPPAPAVQQPPQSAGYPCETSDCNCDDFPTRAEAQRVFDAHGGDNWSGLDRDGDGLVCESKTP